MFTFVLRLHPPELPVDPRDVVLCGVVEEVSTGLTTTVRSGAELLDVLAAATVAAAAREAQAWTGRTWSGQSGTGGS